MPTWLCRLNINFKSVWIYQSTSIAAGTDRIPWHNFDKPANAMLCVAWIISISFVFFLLLLLLTLQASRYIFYLKNRHYRPFNHLETKQNYIGPLINRAGQKCGCYHNSTRYWTSMKRFAVVQTIIWICFLWRDASYGTMFKTIDFFFHSYRKLNVHRNGILFECSRNDCVFFLLMPTFFSPRLNITVRAKKPMLHSYVNTRN